MSNLKMNCGYCGRKCSLEKDFCIPQDSVYICKSCYEWKQKVADLEAKLAESEKDIQKYRQHLEISNKKVIDMDKSWTKDVMELEEQIDQLKQQLAEKDKEVEHYKSWFDDDFSHEPHIQDENQTAITELEKVKDFIIKNNEPTRKMTEITRFINQQIKSLKGDKSDE